MGDPAAALTLGGGRGCSPGDITDSLFGHDGKAQVILVDGLGMCLKPGRPRRWQPNSASSAGLVLARPLTCGVIAGTRPAAPLLVLLPRSARGDAGSAS